LRFLRRHGGVGDRLAFWILSAPVLLIRTATRELVRGNFAAIAGMLGIRRRPR